MSSFRKLLTSLNSTTAGSQYIVFSVEPYSRDTEFRAFTRSVRNPIYTSEVSLEASSAYTSYLRNLQAGVDSEPWFNEWYESAMNCSLDAGNLRDYPQQCQDVDIR